MEVPERYQKPAAELGQALRRLRLSADLTGHQAARLAGMSQSKISKIETGRFLPSDDDVEKLFEAFQAPQDAKTELLAGAAALRTEVAHWRSYQRDGLHKKQEEILQLEADTLMLRVFQPLVVPSLLQTPEYARHVFASSRFVHNEEELARAVAARMERQTGLFETRRRFSFVISESALRWRLCPNGPMLAQLDRISVLSALSNVRVGIIPWTCRIGEVPLHGFSIFDDRFVIVETLTNEMKLSDPKDVETYLAAFDAMGKHTVAGDAARDLLTEIADTIRHIPD